MTSLRARNYERISNLMLLRLAANEISHDERAQLIGLARSSEFDSKVPWGSSKRNIEDVLRIINDRRIRDHRPKMEPRELQTAIRSYLGGRRKDPLVEELTDALCNLREMRLGTNKHPLLDGLQKSA